MRIKLLGGGKEVGRVGILLNDENKKLLIDYGLNPGNPPTFPAASPPVDFALLSHAHLDHSGMLPWLSSHYNTRIYSTPLTKEISEVLYKDMLKIAESNGYPFPYGEHEMNISLNNFRLFEERDEFELDGYKIRFHPAGHIPGSVMIELKSHSMLFSCDINTIETNLLHGAKPVKAKTLFIEGTYAGTEHPDRKQLEKEFLDEIEDTVKKGGKVVIPAFAVGRTQELAILLYEAGYEVWLDGMGSKIAELIIKHGNCIKSPKKLNKAMKSMNIVYSNHGRKLALKSGIVLTTSGMLNGGPVLWYIDKIKDDSKSAVFITGYQVEGTNGRMLLEKKEVNIYGVREKVDCKVKFFDFSAHAGHSQLVNFVKSVSPENVVIFHSENPEALADEINANVIIPENEKEIEI